jgi:hypothetical protein
LKNNPKEGKHVLSAWSFHLLHRLCQPPPPSTVAKFKHVQVYTVNFVASNKKKYRIHMDCLRGLCIRLYTQLISKLIVKVTKTFIMDSNNNLDIIIKAILGKQVVWKKC